MKHEITDYPHLLLGFRVNLTENDANLEPTLNIISNYLKKRGWKPIRSTAGIHRISKHNHYHYHIVYRLAAGRVPRRRRPPPGLAFSLRPVAAAYVSPVVHHYI